MLQVSTGSPHWAAVAAQGTTAAVLSRVIPVGPAAVVVPVLLLAVLAELEHRAKVLPVATVVLTVPTFRLVAAVVARVRLLLLVVIQAPQAALAVQVRHLASQGPL